jgi:hypothetical protein
MSQPELFERSPDARTVVEPSESATDALVRAARRTDVDPLARDDRVHDVVDGDALDRLFGQAQPDRDQSNAKLVLALWNRVFVLTPLEVEAYRAQSRL